MPFLSIHARRSARSESLGETGRVGSVPGNCMRTPLSSRRSLTPGNCAARASNRSKRHLGTKCAWTSMMSCVTEYSFVGGARLMSRSSPRKRGPRGHLLRLLYLSLWVPAFAGTNGGCSDSTTPKHALEPRRSFVISPRLAQCLPDCQVRDRQRIDLDAQRRERVVHGI